MATAPGKARQGRAGLHGGIGAPRGDPGPSGGSRPLGQPRDHPAAPSRSPFPAAVPGCCHLQGSVTPSRAWQAQNDPERSKHWEQLVGSLLQQGHPEHLTQDGTQAVPNISRGDHTASPGGLCQCSSTCEVGGAARLSPCLSRATKQPSESSSLLPADLTAVKCQHNADERPLYIPLQVP